MPIIEYKCKTCEAVAEHIIPHPVPDEIQCKECGHMAAKQLSMFAGYKWGAGNNSASTVPKKYRGGKNE